MELFPHLSSSQLAGAKLDAADILHKNNFIETDYDAVDFVEKALRSFSDEAYRNRFFKILKEIEETRGPGLALSSSVIKTIYGKMKLKASVLTFVAGRNYDNSDLKKAVHNARGIFAAAPYNSKTTF